MFDHSTNKYIFLDIDGVMNNEFDILEKMNDDTKQYTRDDIHFCEYAWDLLGKLCQQTNAKVILSSSWRHGFYKDDDCGDIRVNSKDNKTAIRLLAYFKAKKIPLVGLTSFGFDGSRGQQILDYITKNLNGLTDEWIVIDDEISDMENILPMEHVFKTSFKTGLTQEICNRILEYWGWDESIHVYFYDGEFYPTSVVDGPYDAAPNEILVLDGLFGFKQNYLKYCEKKCYNQDHGAPLYIVTNMPYFLEKAYWNGESFNAYIWSEKDKCYRNVQEYTDKELRGGHNLHKLYVNGSLVDYLDPEVN